MSGLLLPTAFTSIAITLKITHATASPLKGAVLFQFSGFVLFSIDPESPLSLQRLQ
jgi:hypothetical protein